MKKFPYGIQGGALGGIAFIVLLVMGVVVFILTIMGVFPDYNPHEGTCGDILCIPAFIFGVAMFPSLVLAKLFPVLEEGNPSPLPFYIFSFVTYILIGAVLGHFYGKHKNRGNQSL
jgi:hypothetical protein